MTNNKTTKTTALMLAGVLVTSCFVGGTLARYVTTTSSEDSARVAVWGINADNVEMNLFASEYDVNGNKVAKAWNGDKIIAPGTSMESNFSIVNLDANLAPEVMYEIKVDVDDTEIDQRILDNPSIQWKLDNGTWGTWEETKASILGLSGDPSGRKVYQALEIADEFANGVVHSIAWQWKLDDNHIQDTEMGNDATKGNITAKISVKVTARQINDMITNIYLLEGANQTVNLNYIQPLTFKSSANLESFNDVKVNNTVLTKDVHYTAETGSTIITLKEDYLSTLEIGSYVIEIISSENTAKTNFYVVDDLASSMPMIAAGDTWYKGSVPRNNIKTINFVDTASEDIINNANESWSAAVDLENDGQLNKDIMCYLNGDTLTIAGNGSGKIYANYNSNSMFSDSNKKDFFGKLEIVSNAHLLDTSNVLSMSRMFDRATNLRVLDVSKWDTSKVTDMSVMFQNCYKLEKLDVSKWNTSNVTNMQFLFKDCYVLEEIDVSKWNTAKVTRMNWMFANCRKITTLNVSNFNTSNVITLDHTFRGCYELTNIDLSKWDTSKVWSMNGMFHTCNAMTQIDVSNFNTSNVTLFSQMFERCAKLEKIIGLENFDTSKGIVFSEMFYGCQQLKELDLSSFNTKNSTITDYTVSENSQTDYADSTRAMFDTLPRLKKIILNKDFSFKGDGKTSDEFPLAILPTPKNTYIPGANGYWYTEDGTAYTPKQIQDLENPAGTYYAINPTLN